MSADDLYSDQSNSSEEDYIMCGISGELRFDGAQADIPAVTVMSRSQHRRGEDGEGLVSFGNVTLGHRRLKIFDLSDKAAQPLFDPNLGLAITFNGAIYNYQELRQQLYVKGYTFFSDSDTEVLLKAYHCWNLGMLHKIKGIFAFAIWERDSGRLIMARDRMGVKPLYYLKTPSFFRFASTLPALLASGIDRRINNEGLHYYFTFHIVPEPQTLIKDVYKLEPGSVMTVMPDGMVRKEQYWQLRFYAEKENETLTEREWIEKLEDALLRSIKERMVADVAVGVLLSGGLDSSLLVALLANVTNQSPMTFSIGFESCGGEQGDEFHYSDIIARHFSTNHTKIVIETPQLHESLMECIEAMAEPMVSHDAIGFYLLSKEVKKHVTVVQSGQGADELFAGYHWFQGMDYNSVFTRASAETLYERVADNTYPEYFSMITPEYRTSNLTVDYMEDLCRKNGSSNMLDLLQQYESTAALSNGPLARVDNMTMAWGLEAREPFLDPELVRIACSMPASLKLRREGKYALKELGNKLLPKEVVERPKGYFPVPKLKKLGDQEVEWLRDMLAPGHIRKEGIFNPYYVEELLSNPSDYVTPLGASKLWQLAVLNCWMQTHNIH